jgi:hypothetical protein
MTLDYINSKPEAGKEYEITNQDIGRKVRQAKSLIDPSISR